VAAAAKPLLLRASIFHLGALMTSLLSACTVSFLILDTHSCLLFASLKLRV
jgi:hypothetical protein